MTTTTPTPATTEAEVPQPPAVLQQLVGWYVGGMTALMVDLGDRCGLFEAAVGAGPLTCAALAERAGCNERYVREWLGSMVTAGLFTYDPATTTYLLPEDHAPFVTGDGPANFTRMMRGLTMCAGYVEPSARCTREGGGIPYDDFRPEFTNLMDRSMRGVYDTHLIGHHLPAAGVVPVLEAGARVADIGCGTGHTTNLMARAFPASTFHGIDIAVDAIERARAEAEEMGLDNVTFEVADILHAATEPGYALICAFDCIHDQVDPAGVLSWVERALEPGGTFLMVDVAASSNLEENLDHPLAPALYAGSLIHCMSVSLAEGGAGLGNMWGEQRARAMLTEAGLGDVTVERLPDDPINGIFVARRL